MLDKKTRNTFLTVIGIVIFQIIIFVAATIITTPFYETADDDTMAGIALGLWGERDYHLVFMSAILGKIVNFFAMAFNVINWYTVLQFLTIFIAFVVIFLVLLKNVNIWHSIFIMLMLGVTFNFQFYHSLQFTKTAGVITLAGILLLVDLIEHENKSLLLHLVGALFLLLGSLYRFDSYGMVLCTCFLWVLYFFVGHIKKKNFEAVKRYFLWFGIPIILSVGIYVGDSLIYETDEGWKEYGVYNEYRSELLDFGFPDIKENRDLYESLSLTEYGYTNYILWDFADTEKLTTEVMGKLVEAKNPQPYITNIKEFFEEGYTDLLGMPFFIMLIVAIAWYFMHRERKLWQFVAIIAGVLGVEFFFIYVGRHQLAYTNAVIVLTAIVLLCYSIKGKSLVINNKILKSLIYVIGSGVSIVVAVLWFMQGIEKKYDQNQNPDRDEVTDLIYQDKENIYFSKVGYGISPFTNIWVAVEEGEGDNTATLGDWLTMSPITIKQLAKYEVINPYRALDEMDNAYLIDSRSAYWKHLYIKETYNDDVKKILVKNIGGYQIWEFTDEDIILDVESCKTDSMDLCYYGYILEVEKGEFVRGYLYEENTFSFDQRVYLGVLREGETEEKFYPTEQVRNTESADLYNGKYSGFSFWNEGIIDFEKDTVYLYLENENGLQRIEFKQ